MKISFYILPLFIIFCFYGCNHSSKNENQNDSQKYLNIPENSSVWADTITYEVLIVNPDTSNVWESEKIKHVHSREIVDEIFDLIYSKKKIAYNYYSNTPMSIDDIKEIENTSGFNRNKIGKLQFTETWYYDKSNAIINKKIHSILLAYEVYSDSGTLRGYKAAFYIKM